MTPGTPGIQVLEPGLQTTVQDLGRHGRQDLGVSPAGAADPAALILGNRLVGNPIDAAGLEVTLVGPALRFDVDAWVAVTGADLGAVLDRHPLPPGTAVPVRAGQVLRFRGGTRGCRAYVCVAGGIDVPPVLGSRSTDLVGRLGGPDGQGRPLRAGDRLAVGAGGFRGPDTVVRQARWRFVPDRFVARVVVGPHRDHFSAGALETFFGSEYTVTPASDRTGLRLSGPAVPRAAGEILSEGQALGAVQIPPDGQPIVLLAGRATVGGYPKLGVVITPDVALLGQARPGDTIRFAPIDPAEAVAVYRDWWRQLMSGEVVVERDAAVRSPLDGTFYSRPYRGAAPFVRPGDPVEPGTVVGVVEVMQTFFDVRAGFAGTAGNLRVADGERVAAGQVLMTMVPAGASGPAGPRPPGSGSTPGWWPGRPPGPPVGPGPRGG